MCLPTPLPGWDTRTALAGSPIGRRDLHTDALAAARRELAAAAAARAAGDRAEAARHLTLAGRARARFTARTTPAPPPPAHLVAPVWLPSLHTWLDMART